MNTNTSFISRFIKKNPDMTAEEIKALRTLNRTKLTNLGRFFKRHPEADRNMIMEKYRSIDTYEELSRFRPYWIDKQTRYPETKEVKVPKKRGPKVKYIIIYVDKQDHKLNEDEIEKIIDEHEPHTLRGYSQHLTINYTKTKTNE